jgi:putative Mg2+ transporter-C (MgtC) family protein
MPEWAEMVLRLLLAAGLGAAIGFERERHGKAAGLRTHILISAGAALFTLASIYGFNGSADPSRVAAGVVAGIGFIGAGVIFRDITSGGLAGLTSAACIWVTAAIGLAAGAGLYLVSALTTAVTIGILIIPKVRG